MKRAVFLAVAAVAAFSGCAKALAAIGSSASANASVTLEKAAGIDIISPLVLPTVSTSAVVPVTRLGATGVSAVSGTAVSGIAGRTGASLGNATLTIYGQSGDAVSMAVPESFKVIRTGGTETLTVKTSTNSEYDLSGNGVVLGGSLSADTMSVNVGGSLAMAAADQAIPGPYEGLLVVVVQYN